VVETLRKREVAELVFEGALVVTELATNAVLHARSDFTVAVSIQPDAVRIAVRDSSAVLPAPGDGRPGAATGRGLRIVAAVSREWAAERHGEGKIVWAELGRATAPPQGG
jgi:anti-sigma regulatory factor (Ser/Thr protein kinase)